MDILLHIVNGNFAHFETTDSNPPTTNPRARNSENESSTEVPPTTNPRRNTKPMKGADLQKRKQKLRKDNIQQLLK
jgi:hypothetical protein